MNDNICLGYCLCSLIYFLYGFRKYSKGYFDICEIPVYAFATIIWPVMVLWDIVDVLLNIDFEKLLNMRIKLFWWKR